MGPLEIDLFASCLTKQLPRFYSWRPDQDAKSTDAFSQDWLKARGFTNPPWCLIARSLSQIRQQRTRLVVITPLWITQPWYPMILEMLKTPSPSNSRPGNSANRSGCLHGVTKLVAWPISGNPLHHKEFLQKLQISSCPPGD